MTLADDDLLEAIAADYDDFHDYPPTARPHHLISVEDLGWLIRQVQHWRANHDMARVHLHNLAVEHALRPETK